MSSKVPAYALKIVFIYAFAAVVWILASDQLIAYIAEDEQTLLRLGEFKGLLFVLVSSFLLLGILIRFDRVRRLQSERLAEFAARYHKLFEDGSDAMFVVVGPEDTILEANRAAGELYGIGPEALVGRGIASLESETPDEFRKAVADAPMVWHRAAGGRRFPVRLVTTRMRWEGDPVRLIVVRDMSGDLAHQATLDRLAHQDALTGLPNRQILPEHARISLAHAQRTGTLLAVCFLDLDGFKAVNDTYGHEAGDVLLQAMAVRIKGQVRAGDTVVRLGGDEFVLLLGDVNTLGECEQILKRVLTTVAEPVELADGASASVSASIGVAIYPNDGSSSDELLRSADQAMYRAKAEGKNRIAFFNSAHERRLKARGDLLDRVAKALEANQLELWYQPVVSLHDGAVLSFEALLRWRHPILGVLPAADFLPFVSDDVAKYRVDQWVIHRLHADLARWGEATPDVALRINLFAVDSHLPALIDDVQVLAAVLPGARLTVELAARGGMGMHGALETLAAACHSMGVQVCLDGLSSGVDSVHMLAAGTLDEFKVTPALLGMDAEGHNGAVLARGYLAVALGSRRHVVVKQVVSEAQLARLVELGYPAAQGEVFAMPMAADQVVGGATRRYAVHRPPHPDSTTMDHHHA